MSYNDPTERDAERTQLIEPLEAASPYTGTYYDYAQYPYSPYAPPPPREKKKIPIFIFALLGSMALVLGGIIIATLLLKQYSTALTPTQTPTIHPTIDSTVITTVLVPTMTPQNAQVPLISYSAGNVYTAFSQARINMSNPTNDTNWKCCTYYPEGGALVWTDLPTGLSIDIATFANRTEASVDGGELLNQGFLSTSYRNCLLSYETTFPQSELGLYTRTMTGICM